MILQIHVFFLPQFPIPPVVFLAQLWSFFFHIPNLLNTIVRCGETGPLKQKLPKKKQRKVTAYMQHACSVIGKSSKHTRQIAVQNCDLLW